MAVDVIEPLLWRRKGWMRVRLTVAGVAGVMVISSATPSIPFCCQWPIKT